jgi:hypothetical protein
VCTTLNGGLAKRARLTLPLRGITGIVAFET